MMNSILFSQLVTMITEMDDLKGSQMLGYATQLLNVTPNNNVSNNTNTVSESKDTKKSYKATKNFTKFTLTVDGTVVKYDGDYKKTVAEYLNGMAIKLGAEYTTDKKGHKSSYNKELGGYKFKTKTNATKFAKIKVVTADNMNEIIDNGFRYVE